MGVPGMFLWLSQKKSDFILNTLDVNIDYLMLDLNCKIHPICFKIKNENLDLFCIKTLEEKQINAIIDETKKLIDIINPKIGIYIAIDGVAPLAKIKQQRFRRYKSIADKKLFDNIKKKHNKSITDMFWNNSAITPGTKFMEKLHIKILEFIKNSNRKNIIYSSCYEPSEGEHKLLQFIKSNLQYSYVVYGLDADLIFLSLASQSEKIYLMRESNEIDSRNKSNDLKYVDIELMKNYIYQIIQNKIIYILNKKNIINDFIFICYFLGNDFIPHLPSIDIYDSGIDYLIDIYIKTFQNVSYQYLINLTDINIIFFKEFIKLLSLEEDNILNYNYYKKIKKNKFIEDPFEREMNKIDNLLFNIDDPIKLGYDFKDSILENNEYKMGWRERYYKNYWDVSSDELEKFSSKLVEHYLKGLKWITLYYFDKNPSWNWYFPFDFPPFLSDINKYCIDLNSFTFNIGEPLKPFMQLLTVLPPQSNYLLPQNFRKILTNPNSTLAYLYPTDFKQCFLYKKKYWMGIPILPSLDIDLIKYIYYKYEDELTDEEKNRNKILY
jgi:5'-3' exonuclease